MRPGKRAENNCFKDQDSDWMAVTDNKKREKGRNGYEIFFQRLIHRTWKQLDSVEKEYGDRDRTLARVTETTVPPQKEKGQKERTGDSFTERLKLWNHHHIKEVKLKSINIDMTVKD